ncbi:MAG: hypothetical protein SFX74_08620 [Fimbriimonadaceae bacterium]|nr:hypothetical protein [Fimbriimonadaceae bacterium]
MATVAEVDSEWVAMSRNAENGDVLTEWLRHSTIVRLTVGAEAARTL